MSTKLYVGGLPYATTDTDLSKAFAPYGNVVSATVIVDRMTGRSKGFGFVEFETAEEAQKAIDSMDGKDLDGRKITVNIARPMEERAPRRPQGGDGFRGGYGR
jgi:cold-inducible RNA-binding protein